MTHSFPTRRSSDLATPKAQEISTYKYIIVDSLCGTVMFVGMNKILLVTSSALGEHSTSRRIAQRLVEAASEQGLHKIRERDLPRSAERRGGKGCVSTGSARCAQWISKKKNKKCKK